MKDLVIFAPLELFEERYTKQWYEWFQKGFERYGVKYTTVMGQDGDVPKRCGEFLDWYETNIFKMKQMAKIIELLQANDFQGTIFFLDLWFPGIEALSYIRNCAGAKFKIKGILHAGTWDKNDFLSQSGLTRWAKDLETAWFKIFDEVFVGSAFHKQMIIEERGEHCKITPVRFPVYTNEKLRNTPKENIVLFPHRLAPEKNPESFKVIEKLYREKTNDHLTQFVRTADVCTDKKDFYDLLSRSKVSFSDNFQETFGIAMLEAVNLGCIPVAPKKLSYTETLSEYGLYENYNQAVLMIRDAIVNYQLPSISRYHADEVGDIIKRLI